MPETRNAAVQIDYRCDQCGHPVKYTGRGVMLAPPSFIHECPDCRREYTLGRIYPATEPRPKAP